MPAAAPDAGHARAPGVPSSKSLLPAALVPGVIPPEFSKRPWFTPLLSFRNHRSWCYRVLLPEHIDALQHRHRYDFYLNLLSKASAMFQFQNGTRLYRTGTGLGVRFRRVADPSRNGTPPIKIKRQSQ